MMTNNKSSNGMTMAGVVLVAAVLVLMIQTSTTSAARPNGVLPPVVQVAGSSDISRPCRPGASSTGNVQVAPATVRTDKLVHVAAATSDVDRPVPASVNTDKVHVVAATSDVDRPVPASVNTDKVQIAAATSDAVLPKTVVHLAPGPAELARIAASKGVADHPEALDVVGGP